MKALKYLVVGAAVLGLLVVTSNVQANPVLTDQRGNGVCCKVLMTAPDSWECQTGIAEQDCPENKTPASGEDYVSWTETDEPCMTDTCEYGACCFTSAETFNTVCTDHHPDDPQTPRWGET